MRAQLVNWTGNGIWLSTWAIFSVKVLGFSASEVGLAATIGGVAGVFSTTFVGSLADAIGERTLLCVLLGMQAAAVALYPIIPNFPCLILITAVALVAENGAIAVRSALIARSVPAPDRVRVQAKLRAVANIGLALGSGAGGLVLYVDDTAMYTTAILINAAMLPIAAGITLKLRPTMSAGPVAEGRVLKESSYLAITALCAVLALNYQFLGFALPLWIVEHTAAPAWAVGTLYALNTLSVVTLQVRVSRAVKDTEAAARLARTSGWVLALCCIPFALAGTASPGLALILLLIGGAVHVAGELLYAVASWGLALGLAPAARQGQYQGMFTSGQALAQATAPAVIALLIIDQGAAGWATFAALFALSGSVITPVARAALARQKAAASSPEVSRTS